MLEKTSMFTFQKLDFVDMMIQLRKEFPDCAMWSDWDRNNIISNRLASASDDIKFYRTPEGQGCQQKPPRRLTRNQIVKQCCQARAQQLWQRNPEFTIQHVISSDNVRACLDELPNTFQDRTLHDWVKIYCPNRNPGRRVGSRTGSRI
jgi:hypothetical protein